MIVKFIEHGLVVIPIGSIMIKGSRPFYWILLKEANLCYLEWGFHVLFCILLLVIYMYAISDQLPRLGKRELICLL